MAARARWRVCAGRAFFLFLLVCSTPAVAQTDAAQLVFEGDRALKNGAYAQALDLYQAALAEGGLSDAEAAAAEGQAGVALLRLGRAEAARGRFARSRDAASALGDANLAARSAYNLALSRLAGPARAQVAAPDARGAIADAVRGELLPRGGSPASAIPLTALLTAAGEFSIAADLAEDPALIVRARAAAVRNLAASGLGLAVPPALAELASARAALHEIPPGVRRMEAGATLGEVGLQLLDSDRFVEADAAARSDVLLAVIEAFQAALDGPEAGRAFEARGRAGLGALALRDGRLADAETLTEQAILIAERLRLYSDLYRWRGQLGETLARAGRPDAAITAYAAAAQEVERVRPALARSAARTLGAPSSRELVEPVLLGYADLLVRRGDRRSLLTARNVADTLKTIELEQFFRELCVTGEFAAERSVDDAAARTAVLYPIVQADRVDLILSIGADQLTAASTSIDRAALERVVNRALTQLRTPNAGPGPLPELQQLYDIFLRPVAAELEVRGVDTLVFAADGVLRGVPLAAFHDGERFAVERFSVATALSLQLVDARPLERGRARAVVAGVTEALTVRRGPEAIDFSALPAVASEVAGIRQILPTEVLLNEDFTKSALLDSLSSIPFSVLHIASHASFGGTANDSFLLAFGRRGEGAAISLDELSAFAANANVRGAPIELLVLSACDTGVGLPDAETDNAILGLAGAAYKSGARSVVASLWPVFDESTSRLMQRFYRELTAEDGSEGRSTVSKAEALRRAQLSLLEAPETRHPAFWAAFVLVGNWL